MSQVAWELGKKPKDWQADVAIHVHKKCDRKEYMNYRGISLLTLPRKVNAKCIEGKTREKVESNLDDCQCNFRPGQNFHSEASF